MRKYPELLTPKEFYKVANYYVKGLLKPRLVVVMPKYDGSNILKFGDNFYTRNLGPLPRQWLDAIRSRFPELVRSRHNFYFELGGYKNCPAGYCGAWEGEWDYRVFDVYELKPPTEWVDELKAEGLKVVEWREYGTDLVKAVQEAITWLGEWGRKVEGMVVKIYGFAVEGNAARDPDIKKHIERNFIGLKIKWENKQQWGGLLEVLTGRAEVRVEEKVTVLPYDEVLTAVHRKIVELLQQGKKLEEISVNDLVPAVEEEAKKHNMAMPSKEVIRQAMREIKKKIRTGELQV